MTAKITQVSCPTCKKPVDWTPQQKWLIDLGEWLTEERRIPGKPAHLPETPDDA